MFVIRRFSARSNILRQLLIAKTVSNTFHTNYVLAKKASDYISLNIRGENLAFPNVWLRDNCQCEHCFHQSAQSRIIDWNKFNLASAPKEVFKDDNSVAITWDDDHISRFSLEWLSTRSFSPDKQQYYKNYLYKPEKLTWHADEFNNICTKHNYNEIVDTDEGLYNWLHNLSTYGVALIENTPHSEQSIESVIDRVGFKKRTHYGNNFVVQNVADTSNVAYLSSNLQMHTDLPYYEYCPGVNMLHCLVQTNSEGGENLLSDCHYIANYIKNHYSAEYKLLTEVEVEWSDIGTEHGNNFYKLYRDPVICTDKYGNIIRINFSIPQRGSHFPVSIETVKPWYKAHALFFELSQKFAAKFKTKPGDILTFDNIRLLHGRNKYEDTTDNVRTLIGAYVDWDEIYSRLRCLKLKLHTNNIQ